MRVSIAILLACVIATTIAAPTPSAEALERGLIDFLLNTFNLQPVVDAITSAGSALKERLLQLLTQLLFSGTQALNAAKPILSQLLADLQAHAENAGPLITDAVSQLQEIIGGIGKRGLVDIVNGILSAIGLGDVVSIINSVQSTVLEKFDELVEQAFFAGTQALSAVLPILYKLKDDLLAHASDAVPLLTQAISDLQAALAQAVSSRNFFTDALGTTWNTIQGALSAVKDTVSAAFQQALTAVVFAGTQAWAQAYPILIQLGKDLLAHVENAGPLITDAIAQLQEIAGNLGQSKRFLGSLGDQISEAAAALGSSFQATLQTIFTELLFAGTQAWSQAVEVMTQLVADLQAHAENAGPLLTAAFAQLQQILTGNTSVERRALADTLFEFLGVDKIWESIQTLGSSVTGRFFEVALKLWEAGTQAWNQAKEILTKLAADLAAHAENAGPLVTEALNQLQQILNNIGQRDTRDIFETIAGVFGLADEWQMITSIPSQLLTKFEEIMVQVLEAGTAAWAAAKPIFSQLASDLFNHASDATPLINQAIQDLQDAISGAIVGKRGVLDFLGLGELADTISQALSTLADNAQTTFNNVLTQLIFAGTQAWAQAYEVLKQLVADLQAHAEDSGPLFTEALNQLQQIISGSRSDRSFYDLIMQTFGLTDLWQSIQTVGSNLKDQLVLVLEKLWFTGSQAWEAAKPILMQLLADLHAHAGNAGPLVTDAISELQTILADLIGSN